MNLKNKILRFIQKNTIHFAYWGSGIILCLLLFLVYKGVVLWNLGTINAVGFWGVLRWYLSWLGNDLLYFFLVLFLVLFANRFKHKGIKSVFIAVALLLTVFFGADIFALNNFYSRFLLSTLAFFSIDNAVVYLSKGLLALLGFFLLLQICVYTMSRILARKIFSHRFFVVAVRSFLIAGGFIILISFFLGSTTSYQQNILQLQYQDNNWQAAEQDKPYESYFVPFAGKGQRPNIIVVFAESFSSVDSLYAGGTNNILSGFDTIAKDGTVYTNFTANGCTSDSAHIALLQGIEPRETNQLDQNYTRYKSYTLGLPAFLHNVGYTSTFLSTASIGFLDQKDFLISLQFDEIIGPEKFRDWKKYAFNAAPDEALYKKAEEVISKTPATQPLFLVMQTISSHKPYNSPYGSDEQDAFRYSDDQLLQFYRNLQKANYFDNGILLVVGDHRKMQSMNYEEIQKWGDAAYGKTVFAAVGKNIPKGKENITPVQHLDIFSSIKNLTATGSVSLHEFYNDVFGGYVGRDAGIRYCQFVDRQYVGTRADNTTWSILPGQKTPYAGYVRSYYAFQEKNANVKVDPTKPINIGTSSSFRNADLQQLHDAQQAEQGSGQTINTQSQHYPGLITIAHQGYHKTEPVNSLNALVAAKAEGAGGVEMDISFTKDGYPVVIHGPELGRIKCVGDTSVGKKYVTEFDLQEMQDGCKLYNEQPVLTLQETITKIKDMYPVFFIDVKLHNEQERNYVKPMLDSVKKLGLQNKLVFSSTDANVNQLFLDTKEIISGWEVVDTEWLSEVLKKDVEYVLMPHNLITQEIVKAAKKEDKKLVAYTFDDPLILQRLYDWGVRYVMTDNPSGVIPE